MSLWPFGVDSEKGIFSVIIDSMCFFSYGDVIMLIVFLTWDVTLN